VSGCQNKKPVTKIRSTNGANTKHERRTTEQPEKKTQPNTQKRKTNSKTTNSGVGVTDRTTQTTSQTIW